MQLDAVVVGAGPNGLTAAARLARAGWSVTVFEAAPTVGGGARTKPLGQAAVYDVCSSVHPLGVTSPAFDALGLADFALRWSHPPLALAHPFDDGSAATLHRDAGVTAAGLGADGTRWERVVGAMATRWPSLRHAVFAPIPASVVRHPLQMAGFGLRGAWPAALAARAFSTREARALLIGLGAHGGASLWSPLTAGLALVLAAAGHAGGMPFATGGSQSISAALAAAVEASGGLIHCDRRIASLAELPPARAVLLDVTPHQLARLAGRKPPRWRHGAGVWKLDLLLRGPMPWTSEACRAAGTIHLGGDPAAIVAAEAETTRGRLPARPFVLVAQPTVADSTRAPADQHVVWAYRHVPNGCTAGAALDGIEAQFDRFAPGWRDLVLDRIVTTAADYARYNENAIGGDIAGGAMSPWQTLARPRLALDPYRTCIDGVWLCSQATAPGPGVHGMCGWHAAGSVLRAAGQQRANGP